MVEWKLPESTMVDGACCKIWGDWHWPFGGRGAWHPLWSSFNLRHLIQALSNSFTVYYYDLVGYGQSDKSSGDVSLGVQNRILNQLMVHWGLENPCIIGHRLRRDDSSSNASHQRT